MYNTLKCARSTFCSPNWRKNEERTTFFSTKSVVKGVSIFFLPNEQNPSEVPSIR